ncbi:MAG: J domain-containing protein [Chitinophagia bacterium]|nr:J domain-containing protein [Chitinophagia bacterium]
MGMSNHFQIRDYYVDLELTVYASAEDIKWSFRRLAHIYHPDKGKADPQAAVTFQRVLEAYQVLSDPAKRVAYHREISLELPSDDPAIQWETLIMQLTSLQVWVRQTDPFRYDVSGYSEYVAHLCSRAKSCLQKRTASSSDSTQIVTLFIPCLQLVDKRDQIRIAKALKEIIGKNLELETAIDMACKLPGYSAGWPIQQLLIALIITLLLFTLFIVFFK